MQTYTIKFKDGSVKTAKAAIVKLIGSSYVFYTSDAGVGISAAYRVDVVNSIEDESASEVTPPTPTSMGPPAHLLTPPTPGVKPIGTSEQPSGSAKDSSVTAPTLGDPNGHKGDEGPKGPTSK